MGYAKPDQDAGGIHLRQFSRAIIVEDSLGARIAYVSLDNGMVSQLLRSRVLKQLELEFGRHLYNESNVMMSATHTHSGPGGFFQYMLYNVPSSGFISQTLEALVEGVVRSIERAHERMRPARLLWAQGELLGASINRSPTSYANNPLSERNKYPYDTDKVMTLVKALDRDTNEPFAMINWFPVHGTSMNGSNHLISSDNKGYAALLFEAAFNGPETLPGKGDFVAIFAQANEGDVSPNTRGPRCQDTGLPCDLATSTCGDPPRNGKCVASGPGRDMFESTKIIAYKQYQKARELFQAHDQLKPLAGPVRFVHQHIDMSQQEVEPYGEAGLGARRSKAADRRAPSPSGEPAADETRLVNEPAGGDTPALRTCQAALGYAMAAGTIDGPGISDFQQGNTATSRYWNMLRDFLRKPSREQIACHKPKPILLSTGEMSFPYTWHPHIIPTQLVAIGPLVVVGLPGEFTTMAGRRVAQTVRENLLKPAAPNNHQQPANFSQPIVVLSGLSNIYSSYITTLEEYQVQRYEGASTLYGPHTLQAYVQQFGKLARYLAGNKQLEHNGLTPPDLSAQLFSLKPGVLFDLAPRNRNYGDVISDVNASHVYDCEAGKQELVEASFVAGNPRNDIRQEDSFLYVDRFDPVSKLWSAVASDASWETKFIWRRTSTIFGESQATVQWEPPADCQPAVYRFRVYGASKSITQTIHQYHAFSDVFQVAPAHRLRAEPQLGERLRRLADAARNSMRPARQDESPAAGQTSTSTSSSATDDKRAPSLLAPLEFLGSWLGWNHQKQARGR